MSDAKVKRLSFDEYVDTPDVRYENVPTERGELQLGSVTSDDILEWLDENDDPKKKKDAGLRLLVKCVVNPDGTRIPKDKHEGAVKRLRQQDALANGKLVKVALELNGVRAKAASDAKNDSSGTLTADGPSAPQVH